jgi:CheY-like chemotaxis protein
VWRDLKRRLRVLYLDDEVDNLEALRLVCEARWDVTTVRTPGELYAGKISLDDHDVLFLDLVFLDPDRPPRGAPDPAEGLRVLRWVHDRRPEMPVLIVTGIVDPDLRRRLEGIGPWVRYNEKPIAFGEPGFMAMVEEFVGAVSPINA